MADDLNDEWWNHDTPCEEGGNRSEKDSNAAGTKKRERSDENPPVKPKHKRRRRRITDIEIKQIGISANDFCKSLEEHYKGKLSVVEREAMAMKPSYFGPSNPDMSHTVPSILKEALPKWQRLCSAHDAKKSPLAIVISQGAVRALHVNKEASTFKGEKCKTVKLFARHMKQEAQAKFLAANVAHFAIGTPARLASLIAEGSLSLKHTKLVLLDWNWRNVKLKRMVDIPDIKKSLFDLLKDFIIPACQSDHVGLFYTTSVCKLHKMDSPVSAETIAEMLHGINRYNPHNLTVLEKHVDWQVESGAYDLQANLAVLKLYQFNPSYFQKNTVCQILLKALANIPCPDFSLCSSLIDQAQQEDPSIGRLLLLHHLLETCKFTNFWQEIDATPEVIGGVTGLEEAVRKFICHVVSVSHQNINIEDLRAILGDLEHGELEVWINRCGWSKGGNDLIFVANHEENVKTKNIVEKVGFEKVQNLMSSKV